jgi:predicted site-specific integrase-resolvase
MMDTRTGPTLRRQLGYYTTPELAEVLDINKWTLYDFLERGLIPMPTVRLGRRRYYTGKEVERIKEEFEKAKKVRQTGTL